MKSGNATNAEEVKDPSEGLTEPVRRIFVLWFIKLTNV